MEDEVIRKEFCEDIWNSFPYEKAHKYIAWLEKQQGEQKPIFRVGDTLRRKGKDYTFIVDRIQGGYYHCDKSNGAFFPIEEQDNWELIEQNHWSEEDERLMILSRKFLDDAKHIDYGEFEHKKEIEECMAWLKLIKERVKGAVVSVHSIK